MSSSSGASASAGMKVMVVSSPVARIAPQDEQKFDPAGFRCPHWLQNTARGYRLPPFSPR